MSDEEGIDINVEIEDIDLLEDGETYFVPVKLDEDLPPQAFEELREHLSKLDKGRDFDTFCMIFGEGINPLGDNGPIPMEEIEEMLEKVKEMGGDASSVEWEFDSEHKEKVSEMLAGMAQASG